MISYQQSLPWRWSNEDHRRICSGEDWIMSNTREMLKKIFESKTALALIDDMWEEVILELHVITRDGEDITYDVEISRLIVVEEAAD